MEVIPSNGKILVVCTLLDIFVLIKMNSSFHQVYHSNVIFLEGPQNDYDFQEASVSSPRDSVKEWFQKQLEQTTITKVKYSIHQKNTFQLEISEHLTSSC
jgi:hypothetical protein